MEKLTVDIIFILILIALLCEYIDSTLGMGYGTALTPILMIFFGFGVIQIVPAVLLSELLSGLLAAFLHHKNGNVNFMPKTTEFAQIAEQLKSMGYIESFKKNTPFHLKIALLLSSCSIVGTMVAVFIAVNIPKYWVKMYIGVVVLAMGVLILACYKKNFKFSWKKIVSLGIIASFNKGISGGGYGPIVTGGQVLAGVHSKSAVAITSFAEGLTCLVGVLLYVFFTKSQCSWQLAPWLCIGSVVSVPLSTITVKRLNPDKLKFAIALITIALGAYTIINTIKN